MARPAPSLLSPRAPSACTLASEGVAARRAGAGVAASRRTRRWRRHRRTEMRRRESARKSDYTRDIDARPFVTTVAQTCPAIHSTQFPHQDQFSCSKHDSLYSPWP
jgi:hypothetical protein